MIALQLDLFSGKPFAPSFEGAQDYRDAERRAGLGVKDFNPCPFCELRDFCGSDDCAQHLFDLDVDKLVPRHYDEL